ncbi:MAG: EcsC family protein [Chitinophagaceae bacterium]|nr:EcsC family protein [Chitinophagaceae bacterium]
MDLYERKISRELVQWQKKINRKPSFTNRVTRSLQQRVNRIIPEKAHQAITTTIKQMVRAVLFGAKQTTSALDQDMSLQKREQTVLERIEFFKRTAAAEGGLTGLGGILLGLADFPLLIGLKIKLLFEIAALYGHDINDFKERLYILYIFQLSFSSQHNRREVYKHLENWKELSSNIPDDIHLFDWRNFQQEYRDYIDLAKMAQLLPVVGAVVGLVVNYRLINQLGETAMNAYRMRWKLEKGLAQ